jgi:pimeloyl-ACP methyl ester carboxylesterase
VVTLDEAALSTASVADGERVGLWGGDAALRLALDMPEAIEALILEAPAPPADVDRLAALNVPTLVVYGTRDTVVPPASGRVYREILPNCNYVLVYDAGHDIAADRPEAFVSLVADFLERREAFIVTQKSSLLHP